MWPAFHHGDRGADLDAFAILLGAEYARVGRAVGRFFASLVFVAIKAVDGDAVKNFEKALAHPRMREAIEPRVI